MKYAQGGRLREICDFPSTHHGQGQGTTKEPERRSLRYIDDISIFIAISFFLFFHALQPTEMKRNRVTRAAVRSGTLTWSLQYEARRLAGNVLLASRLVPPR